LVKTAKALLLASILGVACAIPAASQILPPAPPMAGASDVRFVSSFVPAGEPVPGECRQEAHAFALALVRYVRPDSWHWVLVCDEAGWRRFLRLSGRDEGAAIYASTDLDASTTYIRGSKLLYPYDLDARPDDIIAHELAHIRLHTGSEARADDLAQLWQREEKQGPQ
jgi:hypothetical protein